MDGEAESRLGLQPGPEADLLYRIVHQIGQEMYPLHRLALLPHHQPGSPRRHRPDSHQTSLLHHHQPDNHQTSLLRTGPVLMEEEVVPWVVAVPEEEAVAEEDADYLRYLIKSS